MSAATEDPIERELRSLTRKVQAARGFCFVAYFVEDRRASRQLQAKFSLLLQRSGRSLVTIDVAAAADLASRTLSRIFEIANSASVEESRPALWVEAFKRNGDDDWDAQRRLLLMRMNERRSRLESELAAPLILLLPAGAQRDAASLAPDLWHVRLHSAVLSIDPTSIRDDADRTPHPVRADRSSVDAEGSGGALPAEVEYWQSLRVGEPLEGSEALPELSETLLFDGSAAVKALLRADRVEEAVELAKEMVDLAQARLDGASEEESLGRTALAAALCEWGDALLEAGRGEDAIHALADGLGVIRVVAELETMAAAPAQGVASLLSFSLGNALLAAGRTADAGLRFRESVELMARSAPDAGADPKFVALVHNRIGDAARAGEDSRAALAAYGESVALWRRLRQEKGDDPSLLRPLAAALTRLGDAERDVGQGERALTAYREGLGLLRGSSPPESNPDRLRDDTVALQVRIGDLERADEDAHPVPADVRHLPQRSGPAP